MENEFHATSGLIAERYLLGELTAAERERFEEHYFSCPKCADSVLAGATFLDGSRTVLPNLDARTVSAGAKARAAKPRFAWISWTFVPQAAFAAAALLAVFTGYQNTVQIPALRARAAEDLTLSDAPVLESSRAAANYTFSAKADRSTVLIQNKWEENYPSYMTEIRNEADSATIMASKPVSARDSLVVSISTGRLKPGKYLMILSGIQADGSRHVVGRYPLTIQN